MQNIDMIHFKPGDEVKEFLVQGSALISAEYEKGLVTVYYMYNDTQVTEDGEGAAITFYCVETHQELPDTFPGQFFGTLHDHDAPADEREPLHLFFKIPRKENVQRGAPVVADPAPGDGGDNVGKR